MLHPKGMRRIFDKEKSNIFSNDFANGKIDTIMGLATLSLRMRKGGFRLNNFFKRGGVRGQKQQEHNHTAE